MSQFITPDELKTHAYSEEIAEIIRHDETIALAAIDMAIEYAESKLMRDYDTDAIFSKKDEARNTLLVEFIKDIAMWRLIGLCSVSIDYDDKKYRNDAAVAWLTDVYRGMPANLPRLDKEEHNSSFSFKSNKKRTNRY